MKFFLPDSQDLIDPSFDFGAEARRPERVRQRTELYATCAFAGAWAYLLVVGGRGDELVAVMSCITITFVLRILAIRYKIRLPI